MKSVFITLLLLLIISNCYCQKEVKTDSLNIVFLFPKSNISDSVDLTVHVIYKNNTKHAVNIYQSLEEGNKGDRFYNTNIEMEKLQGKKYIPHSIRYYQNPFLYRMEDSLRHYDLPKRKLAAHSVDTLDLNLLKITGSFFPGKYRFKAHLRIKTIKNETEYNDKNFETLPPMDIMEYADSPWIYFTVKEYLSIK